jgi:hypothetical protein
LQLKNIELVDTEKSVKKHNHFFHSTTAARVRPLTPLCRALS